MASRNAYGTGRGLKNFGSALGLRVNLAYMPFKVPSSGEKTSLYLSNNWSMSVDNVLIHNLTWCQFNFMSASQFLPNNGGP